MKTNNDKIIQILQKYSPRPASPDDPVFSKLIENLPTNHNPIFVPFVDYGFQDSVECFQNVSAQIKKHGGEIIYGWAIWTTPTIIIEAEFHSVWNSMENGLIDITPRNFEKILFIQDDNTVYKGHQINNIRIPITDFPPIYDFISCEDENFEIMNKGERLYQTEVRLSRAEIEQLKELEIRKMNAVGKIIYRNDHPIPNMPCICGSGKKYKKCCGI